MKQVVLFLALLFVSVVNGFSQESTTAASQPLVRRYVTRPLIPTSGPTPHNPALLIPTWTATTNGYTYRMVGQNPYTPPSGAAAATTISAPIIPVVLTFSDGVVFDPTASDNTCSPAGSAASLTMASPLFNKATFSVGGGVTESDTYIDFFQRANFWQYVGSNPNYHMALSDSLAASLKLTVPAASGTTVSASCGMLGEVEINWLDRQLTSAGFKASGVTPSALPIFLLYNVVMYDTTAANCCVLGYHSAANSTGGIQSYVVGDFDTSGKFAHDPDVSVLSHEIAEWMDDPLGTNPTPPWGNIGEVTGCQSNLEVGDPLAGTDIAVTLNSYTWHVQELAFLSWFYDQSPSIGLNKWYSSNGTFTKFANACYETRTTLSIAPTNIAAGGSATVNIKVTELPSPSLSATATPTGSVALVSGATGQTLMTWPLTNGAVTNANLSGLPTGSYPLTASYAGDGTDSPSNSAPVIVNVGTSTVTFAPIALNFGNQTVQTASGQQTVKVTNNGTAPLTISKIALAGASPGDYSETNTCLATAALAPAASCGISVTFKPTATGIRTASISVTDNATGSPQSVPLSGNGVSGGTGSLSVAPLSLSFGSVNLGSSSASQTVTLSNTGTAGVRVVISLKGSNPTDFPSTDNCPQSLAGGASCIVTVTFKPLLTGMLTATLNFGDGAAVTSAPSVALSGTGASSGTPVVKLSPTSLAFGSEPQGSETAGQDVTITNTGTGALAITSISLTGTNPHDFDVSGTCPSLIAVNASCTVILRFRPIETGALSATLSVADNASGSPQTVALTGTGTVPVPVHGH
jgi:hypothetical protein